ncbi:unnamed protein product [Laminaria digitata]
MRTAILFYYRSFTGRALKWATISMGKFKNGQDLFSDKKASLENWKTYDPLIFNDFETKYLPDYWTNSNGVIGDIDDNKVYVMKDSDPFSFGGAGISFMRGKEVNDVTKSTSPDLVIQEFVDPLTYEDKKTHCRFFSLVIVQPDGTREFFVYRKAMLFLAYYVFDEKKLIENPEGSNGMLLINVHQFESSFRLDPNTTGKFDMSLAIKDFEHVLDDSSTFASMFEGMKDIHTMIFSMVGDIVNVRTCLYGGKGPTPLHLACFSSLPFGQEAVTVLVDYGASIDAKTSTITPPFMLLPNPGSMKL